MHALKSVSPGHIARGSVFSGYVIRKKIKPWLVLILVFGVLIGLSTDASSGSLSPSELVCQNFSALENEDYWPAMSRCAPCTENPGCGFCQSTLQCLLGSNVGPVNGSPCSSWSFSVDSCPAIPNCGDFTDCNGCALRDECAWCASEAVCTTVSEAFSKDCRGLVFEPPCPENYVSGT